MPLAIERQRTIMCGVASTRSALPHPAANGSLSRPFSRPLSFLQFLFPPPLNSWEWPGRALLSSLMATCSVALDCKWHLRPRRLFRERYRQSPSPSFFPLLPAEACVCEICAHSDLSSLEIERFQFFPIPVHRATRRFRSPAEGSSRVGPKNASRGKSRHRDRPLVNAAAATSHRLPPPLVPRYLHQHDDQRAPAAAAAALARNLRLAL